MRTLTVDRADWQKDRDGVWLRLHATSPEEAIGMCAEMSGIYDVAIKHHVNKRSLDANAYAWVLIGELSQHYGVAKEQVYRQAIAVRRVLRRCRRGNWND